MMPKIDFILFSRKKHGLFQKDMDLNFVGALFYAV